MEPSARNEYLKEVNRKFREKLQKLSPQQFEEKQQM